MLMRRVLFEELQRLRISDQFYKGEVFLNRDDKVNEHRHRDSQDEEVLVYQLYAAVHEQTQGELRIDGTPIWLFSCEVPNQGKELSNRTKKRRADLVGLRQDGSLVVFECKGPHNSKDSPLFSVLEGMDYLGCLLTENNVTRLNQGLQDWISQQRPQALGDNRFSSAVPDWPSFAIDPLAKHGVIVLAPQTYFDLHINDANGRSQDWWLLSNRFASSINSALDLDLDFATVDFGQGSADLLKLPT